MNQYPCRQFVDGDITVEIDSVTLNAINWEVFLKGGMFALSNDVQEPGIPVALFATLLDNHELPHVIVLNETPGIYYIYKIYIMGDDAMPNYLLDKSPLQLTYADEEQIRSYRKIG